MHHHARCRGKSAGVELRGVARALRSGAYTAARYCRLPEEGQHVASL
jgi:hypothetical protein